MGLYQYIREQGHRNDLVGELGRRLLQHEGEYLDNKSLAFELAAQEYAACGDWTRQGAIERLNGNEKFQRILKIEPRISEIISEVIKTKGRQGYLRYRAYSRFKGQLSKLVGYKAEKNEVSDSASYDVVIEALADLLPPDQADLYQTGLPENVDLDL